MRDCRYLNVHVFIVELCSRFVRKVFLQVLNYQVRVIAMAKKLYVGNLPYSATGDELKSIFSAAGEVASATVIMDKMSGRSKGFGFVEFNDDGAADKAIEMFNGKDMGGRPLTVNEARPMTERAPRG